MQREVYSNAKQTVMYYSDHTSVLTPDGYKKVSEIKEGDYISNFLGQGGQVTEITQLPNYQLKLVEITRNNWVHPFYCTKNTRILVTVESESSSFPVVDWIKASDLKPGMELFYDFNVYKELLEEFIIDINGQQIKPTTELGYLFGLYCLYGSNCGKTVIISPPSELLEITKELLSGLFRINVVVDNNKIHCYNTRIVEFFQQFGSIEQRTVPEELWVNNPAFSDGVFKAIVETNDQGVSYFRPRSKSMYQTFLWICGVLDIEFTCHSLPNVQGGKCYYLIIKKDPASYAKGKITKVSLTNIPTKLWNIKSEFDTVIVDGLAVMTTQ